MKRIISFIIIILCLFCNNIIAQDNRYHIDSLLLEVELSSNDSSNVIDLGWIGYLYSEIDFDSALFYVNKSIELAEKIQFTIGVAHGYYDRGYIYYDHEEFANSLKDYLFALDIYVQENDSINMGSIYTDLGELYALGYDKHTALNYNIQALEISEHMNDSSGIAVDLNNIGLIYMDIKNYDKAIEYMIRSLEIELKFDNEEYIAISYLNIASIYLDQKLFDNAYKNIIESYKRIDKFESPDLKIEIYSLLGEYYLDINKSDSAFYFINKALDKEETFNKKRHKAYNNFLLGRYFMLKDKFDLSVTHFSKAIMLSDSLDIKEYIDVFYKYRAEAYFKLGNYKNAFNNLQQSYAHKDSIHEDKLSLKLGEFERQIELERIQNEFKLEDQKKQGELEKGAIKLELVTWFSILIIIFLIAIVVTLISNYRIKSKAYKILKTKNDIEQHSEYLKITIDKLEENEKIFEDLIATKDKFFSIIAHDLRNSFNILVGYSDLLMNDPTYKNDPKKLDKIIKTIYNTSEHSYSLLVNLLDWANSQSGHMKVVPQKFNLAGLIDSKTKYFMEMAGSKEIELNFDYQANIPVFADQNMIFTVLRNLIINAVKFTNRGGRIKLFTKLYANTVEVSVSDNGIGISKKEQKKLFRIDSDFKFNGSTNVSGTGLGLILCYEFIKLNGGEISVVSEEEKGSIFTFTLPIENTDE